MDYARLCISCMREKPHAEAVCPHCGFDQRMYVVPPYVLPPYTILNGKYLTGKVLGAGGFGITYLAMDMALDRVVAIKEFFVQGSMHRTNTISVIVSRSNVSETQEKICQINRQKFENEAKVLAHLDDMKGIVRVYDFFEENETSYIAMEYLAGMTLKDYVKSRGGRLPFSEVVESLSPVMESLQTLHERGILHRDISPDNIMVLEEGGLKLFDFGGVKLEDGNGVSMCILAKAGYTPIEQVQTGGKQGPWTDVYAMAATIYYCICGKAPEDAANRVSTPADSLVRPSACQAELSPEMEAVLLRGLSIREKDRYQTMREFQDALSAPAAFSEKPVKKSRKWMLPVGIGAAAVLVALLILVLFISGVFSPGRDEGEIVYVDKPAVETEEEQAETTRLGTEESLTETPGVSFDEETSAAENRVTQTEMYTLSPSGYPDLFLSLDPSGEFESIETGFVMTDGTVNGDSNRCKFALTSVGDSGYSIRNICTAWFLSADTDASPGIGQTESQTVWIVEPTEEEETYFIYTLAEGLYLTYEEETGEATAREKDEAALQT